MKGLVYLRQACALLWNRRQDFELLVTDRPTGDCEPFVRFIGWQSQSDLAQRMQDCDLLAVPTIAQEALGRTAVEAMAAGRPVVASRIGGLKSTVLEGCTGLLAEPGNPVDLAAQIERLLDDAPLREQLGHAGRRRFEECFSWNVIIPRFYRPLLEVRPAHSHNHPNPN
jgi:glycosyltransferase involved in cell wall biosynthesis